MANKSEIKIKLKGEYLFKTFLQLHPPHESVNCAVKEINHNGK